MAGTSPGGRCLMLRVLKLVVWGPDIPRASSLHSHRLPAAGANCPQQVNNNLRSFINLPPSNPFAPVHCVQVQLLYLTSYGDALLLNDSTRGHISGCICTSQHSCVALPRVAVVVRGGTSL